MLLAERVGLNLVQRMRRIATRTAEFVALVDGTGARITDTRKTTPGLRALERYAVRCGGGPTTASASPTPSWPRTTTWPS